MDQKPICDRAVDLVSYLYGETDERETRDFENHLRQCDNCQREAASFSMVRESVVTWRDEVLTGFVSSTAVPPRRSAVAALRQFFDLSPLWLKGATAFATVAFCVLAVLFAVSFKKETATPVQATKTYTEQDVNRLIEEAVAKQRQLQQPVERAPEAPMVTVKAPQSKTTNKQTAKGRRPLSRAEREQLAADLRLLPTDDDVDLFGDRINE